MKFGVVGDDITGCVDIGLMFQKGGYFCDIFMKNHPIDKREDIDVVIVDTDSRFINEKEAYQRVYQRTKELKTLGFNRFYKKTCSVFRGNVGIEFDAMMDALGEDYAVIVAGFPETGRTTIHSKHYVDGILLENTQFKDDPMNPMLLSDIREIIRKQSKKNVSWIWWEDLDKGVAYVRERVMQLKNEAQYICFDVRDRHDLTIIAKATFDAHVFGGSSALALELAKLYQVQHSIQDKIDIPTKEKGILCCCGSVTKQSAQQIECLKSNKDYVLLPINPIDILEGNYNVSNIAKIAALSIEQKKHVLLHTLGTGDPAFVNRLQKLAHEKGIEADELGNMISACLAETMAKIQKATGQYRLILAGGETSYYCCEKLKVRHMQIYEEVESGIPACIAEGRECYFLILKSGSFGSEDFFENAIKKLLQ